MDPCSFCSGECCKTYLITVTSFDILRIQQKTGKRPEQFSALHSGRLLFYDDDTILQFDDGTEAILGLKSHPCIFLNGRRCSIYEHAPLSCRCYPHTLYGSMKARFCPIIPRIIFWLKGPDKRMAQAEKEFSEYKKIVKKWNANPGKREECLRFLLNVSKSVYL